jgi:hypothetical protein
MEINSLNENNYFLIKYEINLISIYKIHQKDKTIKKCGFIVRCKT